jgi:hypothetical protein
MGGLSAVPVSSATQIWPAIGDSLAGTTYTDTLVGGINIGPAQL